MIAETETLKQTVNEALKQTVNEAKYTVTFTFSSFNSTTSAKK